MSDLKTALAAVKTAEQTPAAPAPPAANIVIGAALPVVDANNTKDEILAGSADMNKLFTSVRFTPTASDVYARERELRNKTTKITGYSRKVADVQIELAHSGVCTSGTISMVQELHEKEAHLEMSLGVWNPDTRKSSFVCLDPSVKERLKVWKDGVCAQFLALCDEQGIDISSPPERAHANSVKVNLLQNAPAPR